MIEVSDERFEELVEQGLDRIPDEFLRHLTNVVILIGEYNEQSPHILGLYEGVALTRKTANQLRRGTCSPGGGDGDSRGRPPFRA